MFIRAIRMQDPLKQGLKLPIFNHEEVVTSYSNARSIKTRIETNTRRRHPSKCQDSNARSIKTRIET